MHRLHAAQKSIYIHHQNYGGYAYHRSIAMELTGHINIAILKESLAQLLHRHELLRSKVKENALGPEFLAIPNATIDFLHISARNDDYASVNELADTLKKLDHEQFLIKPIDLQYNESANQLAPWRVALIEFPEQRYQLCLLFHHVFVDRFAIEEVILPELSQIYNALMNKTAPSLPVPPALSQLTLELDSTEETKRIGFWKKKFEGYNAFKIETDMSESTGFQFQGERLSFQLESELITALTKQYPDYSINSILTTAMYILVYIYTGETNLCIGEPSSNRQHTNPTITEKLKKLVTCSMNTIPLNLTLAPEISAIQLLPQVKQVISDSLKNQLPLDIIMQRALNARLRSAFTVASPFTVALGVNRAPNTLKLMGVKASLPIEPNLGISKFYYFGINCDETLDHSYDCYVEFNSQLFTRERMQRLSQHFKNTLIAMTNDPNCSISSISILTTEEKTLIQSFNHTHKPSVFEENYVHDIFHRIAKMYPQQPFVYFHTEKETISKTYGDVDRQAVQLSNFLRKELRILPQTNIAYCVARSIKSVSTPLGILMSGCVMIPLSDSGIDTATKLNSIKCTTLLVDEISYLALMKSAEFKALQSRLTIINLDDPAIKLSINNMTDDYQSGRLFNNSNAYIMYTSGSSGIPKATISPHKGLKNLAEHLAGISRDLSELKLISTQRDIFDGYLFDLLAAIVNHGELHLTSEALRYNPIFLNKTISKYQINFGVFLADLLPLLDTDSPLMYIISMGADPHKEAFAKLAKKPGRILKNLYGTLEMVICATDNERFILNETPIKSIGFPIQNLQAFIFNERNLQHNLTLHTLPIGARGVACFTGSFGQYVDQALNSEKYFHAERVNEFSFIRTQVPAKTASRFYNTQDYMCYTFINNKLSLVYCGRADNRKKLHGIFVDPNDVAEALRKHDSILDVVVLFNEANTSLKAFIILKPHRPSLSRHDVAVFLRKHSTIPPITYPKMVIEVSEFPHNVNNKIDTFVLQKMIPPHLPKSPVKLTGLAKKLRTLWANILDLPENEIDLHDEFDECGGNSLIFASLISSINDPNMLGIKLTETIKLSQLNRFMTILDMQASLENFVESLLSRPASQSLMASLNPSDVKPSIYNTPFNLTIFPNQNMEIPPKSPSDPIPDRPYHQK